MATKTVDPAEAIVQRIAELQEEIQPKRDEIAAIGASIKDTEEEIRRLEMAASALRGEIPTVSSSNGTRTRARRGSTPDVEATPEELIAFLRSAGEPQSATQIREGLNIAEDVPGNKVSAFLAGLVETEQIGKEGEKRGTRYSAL